MTADLARRRALLTAALGFALLDTRGTPAPPEVQTVRRWLDNWQGLGHVVTGMQRQDYDLELVRHDGRGWRATFFVTSMEHSLTSMTGVAHGPTPWRAVKLAAWDALGKVPVEEHEPSPAENRDLRAKLGAKLNQVAAPRETT